MYIKMELIRKLLADVYMMLQSETGMLILFIAQRPLLLHEFITAIYYLRQSE